VIYSGKTNKLIDNMNNIRGIYFINSQATY
jgi:hypothetical protein